MRAVMAGYEFAETFATWSEPLVANAEFSSHPFDPNAEVSNK